MRDVDQFVEELNILKRDVFGELPADVLEQRIPFLTQFALEILGQRSLHPQPLRRVLKAAVADLEPESLRKPCQELFGLSADSRGKTLSYRQDRARSFFTPPPARNTFRQSPRYTPLLVKSLAERLAAMEPIRVRNGDPAEGSAETIKRESLVEEAVRSVENSQKHVTWLWGEPGSGKSTLAEQAAKALNLALPAVIINCRNERILHGQLLEAIANDDEIDARNWSEAACLDHFRRMAESGRYFSLVILDDLNDVHKLTTFLPSSPSVPFIVTSQIRADDPNIHPVQVPDFSPDEARTLVRRRFPGMSEELVPRLVDVLGHRPLAIDHVCRFIELTPNIRIATLVEALIQDVSTALDTVTSTDQRAELALTAVYKRTIAALENEGLATDVLDSLLWISGVGSLDGALVSEYLAHRFSGSLGQLSVTAAKISLSRRGLITWGDQVRISPLSLRILQSLRPSSMIPQLSKFRDFLSPGPSLTQCTQRICMAAEMGLSRGCFNTASGDAEKLLCLDQITWVRFGDSAAAGGKAAVIYTVDDSGILANTTGQTREYLSDSQMTELVDLVRTYFEMASRYHFGRLAFAAPPANNVSEPDAYSHKVRKGQGEVNGINVVTALCGKRWRGSKEHVDDKETCPECLDRGPQYYAYLIENPPRPIEDTIRAIQSSLAASDVAQAELNLGHLEDDLLLRPKVLERLLALEDQNQPLSGIALTTYKVLETAFEVAKKIADERPEAARNLYSILERKCRVLLDWNRNLREVWWLYAIGAKAWADLSLDETSERIRLYRQSAIANRAYTDGYPEEKTRLAVVLGMTLFDAAELLCLTDSAAAVELYDEAIAAFWLIPESMSYRSTLLEMSREKRDKLLASSAPQVGGERPAHRFRFGGGIQWRRYDRAGNLQRK